MTGPGNVNQALGVAEALDLPHEVKDIRYTRFATLPNIVRGASTLGLTGDTIANLKAPWPDIVIGAGRRVAPVARWIKRRPPGGPFWCRSCARLASLPLRWASST